MYTGWIAAAEGDRVELEELGVVVGPWNPDARVFDDCVCNSAALTKLGRLRHRFVLGLFTWSVDWCDTPARDLG
jgi:hypothetical protein